MEVTDFLDAAEHAARLGGEILLDWSQRFTVREKSRANLVTEADFASQKAIFHSLRSRFPTHGLVGEEDVPVTEGADADYRWIVDPLDGTSNYVHGFPYYAVSIALEMAGRLAVGVIYDPNRNEMFTAATGLGTRLNGVPLQCSSVQRVSEAMCLASLPVGTHVDNPAVARFLRVLPLAQTVQRTGSAALNLAYVAAGRVDSFWSTSLKPWDVAAGAIIVEQAGGQVSAIDGSPFLLDVPSVLASNGTSLHSDLARILASNE